MTENILPPSKREKLLFGSAMFSSLCMLRFWVTDPHRNLSTISRTSKWDWPHKYSKKWILENLFLLQFGGVYNSLAPDNFSDQMCLVKNKKVKQYSEIFLLHTITKIYIRLKLAPNISRIIKKATIPAMSSDWIRSYPSSKMRLFDQLHQL